MRIKLILLTLLVTALSGLAATGVRGTLVDAKTGAPVGNANVLISDQGIFVTSSSDGTFVISNAQTGRDVLEVIASGYNDSYTDIDIVDGIVRDLGEIKLDPSGLDAPSQDSDNMLFNEDELLDDEGLNQSVGTIQGATDDVYYQAQSFKFQPVRFRFRGLDQQWSAGYINGMKFNDAMRGLFNYSQLGGMTSSAFRSRSTDIGLAPSAYGFGGVGGSSNYTTYASEYAPGWRGNLSYTNSNYMLRAMLQYSTGLNKHGWAFSMALIGRWAPEGVIEGTFYNSFGYFLSLQKVFNDKHSLNISTWGAPTQRATNAAATQEAYDLAGSNLYNPSWGYLDGKKKSSRIVESFDPSVTLNWIWKPRMGVQLNTGAAFRASFYSSSALNWYMAPDPRPDYYRNLPSYFKPTADRDLDPDLYAAQLAQQQYVADWWGGEKAHRQLNWDMMYQTNLMNRQQYDRDPSLLGQSTYILENRHSNFMEGMFNTTLDMRLSDWLTTQMGLHYNYTNAHYYKTIRNLLGGEYWRDVDNFSERDFAGNPDIMQNDLRNPNRKVYEGDTFGYDYNIHNNNGGLWIQTQSNTRHWNMNVGMSLDMVEFQREGQMLNGRAENEGKQSLGYGQKHIFVVGAAKFGATYKLDGRNYFTVHVGGGNRAPLPYDAYISPRTKDEAVRDLRTEKYLSADISYTWNYNRFRGSITGFYMRTWDTMKKTAFYDYELSSFVNYVISGMQTEYKGVELGMEFKILSNLSITAAGTFSRYQYKNNPMGVRSYENGTKEDVMRRVYYKNYHIGGTPQQVYSVGVNYNIKNWFFEVNGQWFGDNWFDISPARHEEMPGLWKFCTSEEQFRQKQAEIANQEKLNNAWVMNLSIGKVIYTKFGSVNFNLSVNNLLNNRKIQTGGWQEGKFDYTDYNVNKFPNKIWYAQGIRVFFNVGIRF
ncbi:MAG: carboxypeptidase-like regulatory domain-containing protein [Bacteroidales bacterium]|nr:carboxypeptidase-like regulatory domain-containing protein [Bacteroidales bacterium]